ncbi:MAG: ABC transporter permease [Candidatus Dormibacteria bacterium]
MTARPAGRGRGAPVLRFASRRLVTVLLTLWAASILVFVVLNVLPGTPAQVILGTQATPASVRALTIKLGLNQPLVLQYLHWMGGLLTLHLGNSYISGQPIGPEIGAALEVTAPLVALGLLLGIVIAVPTGILSAVRHRHRSGAVLSAATQLGIAIPNFVLGILLIIVVSVDLRLLPASGFVAWSTSVPGALQSLVLPAISLGLVEGAILSRYTRTAVLGVLRADFLRTARATGMRTGQALVRHGIRNAAVPVITVLGLELSGLIIGAVVIEAVFTLPGVGSLLLSSVANRDLIMVQDIVMLVATVVVLTNLLVDILYRLVDPRIGLGS